MGHVQLPTRLPADFARPLVWGDRSAPDWMARQLAAEQGAAPPNLAIVDARLAWLRATHKRDLWFGREYGTHRNRVKAQKRAACWRRDITKWLRWKRHFEQLMMEEG